MRGEERPRPDAIVQMLDDAPRQAQAVERARAAANLIENNQAARRGVVQDVGRLAHLDHEGGLPAREVVARADAGEDAVHQINARVGGGNKRTGVRQQNQQRNLPDVGALAGHVRPGDEADLRMDWSAAFRPHHRTFAFGR